MNWLLFELMLYVALSLGYLFFTITEIYYPNEIILNVVLLTGWGLLMIQERNNKREL